MKTALKVLAASIAIAASGMVIAQDRAAPAGPYGYAPTYAPANYGPAPAYYGNRAYGDGNGNAYGRGNGSGNARANGRARGNFGFNFGGDMNGDASTSANGGGNGYGNGAGNNRYNNGYYY
jgi:hypothetical protein